MFGGSLAVAQNAKGGPAKTQPPPAKGKPAAGGKGSSLIDPAQEEAQLKAEEEAKAKRLEEAKSVERLKIEA